MPKTPTKLKKPEPRACGDIRYRVVRGPREADGRWYWRAERYFSGGAETVWTGWGTVVEADRQVVALAAGGGARAPAETDLVADLLAYWLGAQEERPDISAHTLRIRTDQCAHLKSGLGAVLLSRLDRAAMEGYRDRQLRAGRAPVTVGHELSVLRTAWQWGRECGVCPAKELPSVRVKIVRRRDTPEPDRGAVVAALEHLKGWPRLAVLLQIAARLHYHPEPGEEQPGDGWKSAVADHLAISKQRISEVWGGAIVRPSTLRRWLAVR